MLKDGPHTGITGRSPGAPGDIYRPVIHQIPQLQYDQPIGISHHLLSTDEEDLSSFTDTGASSRAATSPPQSPYQQTRPSGGTEELSWLQDTLNGWVLWI